MHAIHYRIIESAIEFIAREKERQPSLEDIAASVNLSPSHFQKVFTEWAGISPKKFLQYLTVESLKSELLNKVPIEVAADRHGLSTASRVYDHFVTIEAMTPGEYAAGGKSIEIRFGIHPSPFGECLIATTARGICRFAFTLGDTESAIVELRKAWPRAVIVEDDGATTDIATRLIDLVSGKERLSVVLKGTPFQIKVWEALLRIPFGGLTTYGDLAEEIGSPGASRAVGTAVGQNPIAFLIPCHRVIRREGKIGDYYYGSTMKTAMLGWERGMI